MRLGDDDKTPADQSDVTTVVDVGAQSLMVKALIRSHEAGKFAAFEECRETCKVLDAANKAKAKARRRTLRRAVLTGAAVALIAGAMGWASSC